MVWRTYAQGKCRRWVQRCQAFLQTIAEGIAICAEGDCDRQAEKLRRRVAPSASRRRTPTKPVSEQPRRELASADTAARAADATVQIIRASPGPSLRPLVHRWPLPSAPTPTCSQCLSCDPVRRLQDLAAGDLCPTHSLIAAARPSLAPRCPHEVNVTLPYDGQPDRCTSAGLARMRKTAMMTRGTATRLPVAKIVENDNPTKSRNGPVPNAATP